MITSTMTGTPMIQLRKYFPMTDAPVVDFILPKTDRPKTVATIQKNTKNANDGLCDGVRGVSAQAARRPA
jgi:hypothetical protein